MNTDEEARKARAMHIREQIKQIVSSDSDETDVQPQTREPSVKQVTPREFIHRRMHELDRDAKEDCDE